MRLHENIGLPYAYPGHVQYETGTNISQTNINNTFIQLVDNDLYIENKLANDYAYTIGPKVYNKDVVDQAEDGYKTWGSFNSAELSVLHKVDLSLKDSLTSIFKTGCNFIMQYNSQYYAGTDDALVFADDYAGTWRVLKAGRCNSYFYDAGNNVLLFAFDDGIYHLRLTDTKKKLLLKITADEYCCKALLFRTSDSLLFVATEDKLYYAYYSNYHVPFDEFENNYETVKLHRCDIYDDDFELYNDIHVNAFADIRTGAFPLRKSIFAGTDSGLIQLSSTNDYEQYSILQSGYSYTCAKEYNNKVYVGTKHNGILLYDIQDNSASATSIAEGEVTCLETFRNSFYACVDGKLYEDFAECTVKEDGKDESISGIKKIAFIGNNAKNAFIVLAEDTTKKIYYGFGHHYDKAIMLDLDEYEFDDIYDICTIAQSMTLDIAAYARATTAQANENFKRTLIRVVFPKIHTYQSNEIEKLKLVKDGDVPYIATANDVDIIKQIDALNGKQYIVTSSMICRSDDQTISCGFNGADGNLARINDAIYIPNKRSFVVLLEGNQLSAVPESLNAAEDPTQLEFIGPMAESMQQYGLSSAYSYKELSNYAFIVTKQDVDAEGKDCDDDIVQIEDKSKYFVAYVDADEAGIECGFLKSPVNADIPTTLLGTFDAAPELYVKNGKLVVFDKNNSKIAGSFSIKQQQFQNTRTFFSIEYGDLKLVDVLDSNIAENYILTCAQLLNGAVHKSGLFLNKVTVVKRVAADMYQPMYDQIDGKKCKCAISGNVFKTTVVGSDIYICTDVGLFKTDIQNLVELDDVNVADLSSHAGIEQLVSGHKVNDVAVTESSVIAATDNGIEIIAYRSRYTLSAASTIDVQGISDVASNVQIVAPAENGMFQLIYNSETSSLISATYDQECHKTNSGLVDGLSTVCNDFIYCSKYVDDEIQDPTDPSNDFIALLDIGSNDISAVYYDDSSCDIRLFAHDENVVDIAQSTFQSEANIDARYIITTTSEGELSSFHSIDKNTLEVVKLEHTPASLNGIIAVGSRFGVAISPETEQSISCQYVYQINNSSTFNSVYMFDEYGQYKEESSGVTTHALPSSVANKEWSKFKIVGSVLYAQINSELHIVELDKLSEESLTDIVIQDVDDIYFGYECNIVKQSIDGNIVFSAVYDDGTTAELQFADSEFNIATSCLQTLDNIAVAVQYIQDQCKIGFFDYRLTKVSKHQGTTEVNSIIYYPYYQTAANIYNVYMLNSAGKLEAAYFDDNALQIDSPLIIRNSNVESLFIQNMLICVTTVLGDERELLHFQYQNNSFSLVKDFDISSVLQTQSGQLTYRNIVSPVSSKMQVHIGNMSGPTFNCNMLNAVLGVKDTYDKAYVKVAEYADKWCILQPYGSYIQYNEPPTANNSEIQQVIDDALISNGKLAALKLDNGEAKWFEIDNNIEIIQNDDIAETVGGKLVTSVVLAGQFDDIRKVICSSRRLCFVQGTKQNDIVWWYIYKNRSAAYDVAEPQLLAFSYMQSGISWIDQIEDKHINNIYDDNGLVFYTNAGIWSPLFSQSSEFVDGKTPQTYSMRQEDENILNENSDEYCTIQLFKSSRSQTYSLAKVQFEDEYGNEFFNVFDVMLKTANNQQQLNIEDAVKTTNEIKRIFIAQDSPRTDFYYVVSDENTGNDMLYNQSGIKTMLIDDKRDSSAKVLDATSVCYAKGMMFVLGDSSEAMSENSFMFQSFNRDKLCFIKHNSNLSNEKITLLQQNYDNIYFVGYVDAGHSYICNIDMSKIEEDQHLAYLYECESTVGVLAMHKVMLSDALQLPTYYFAVGNKIIYVQIVTDDTSWKELISIDDAAAIKSFFMKTVKDLVIATDVGLYYTYSKYQLVNDIKKLTPNDVLDLFYENEVDVDKAYNAALDSHIAARHAPGSVLTRINNDIMDTKFSNISEDWIQFDISNSGETIVYNDLVSEVKFGEVNVAEDKLDDTIYANTLNTVCNCKNADLNYIMKRWMSGYTELYISLPTTNTYYLNHILGTPNCTVNPNDVLERKNLGQLSTLTADQKKLNGQISANCTHIDLALDKAEYSIDELLEVSIHGNSLPLKIYRDNIDQHYDNVSSRLYQSLVLPSVLEATDFNSQDGYYHFQFACFGTDAQAIKIAFNDRVNVYGSKYYTIEFNSNGGAGRMQSQKISLDATAELKKNTSIYKDSNAFLGWSLKATVDGMATPMFLDGQSINKNILESAVDNLKILPRSKVTLFAVWEEYELPENADSYTKLTVDCRKQNQQLSAVYSCEFADGILPMNTLIVDYGD